MPLPICVVVPDCLLPTVLNTKNNTYVGQYAQLPKPWMCTLELITKIQRYHYPVNLGSYSAERPGSTHRSRRKKQLQP